MTVEQRLAAALSRVDEVEPTPDLWSRVVHSIEEDRRHRRNVLLAGGAIVAAVVSLVGAGAVALVDRDLGRSVHHPTMVVLETVALVALTLAIGPAIRRFGRGYVQDLWPPGAVMPTALLRLLDIAYHLVFAGYILVTTRFEFSPAAGAGLLANQIGDAVGRIGGLLLLMGLLHAATMMAIPMVALVDNATRAGRALPRWIVVVLAVVGAGIGLFVVPNLIGVLIAGAS